MFVSLLVIRAVCARQIIENRHGNSPIQSMKYNLRNIMNLFIHHFHMNDLSKDKPQNTVAIDEILPFVLHYDDLVISIDNKDLYIWGHGILTRHIVVNATAEAEITIGQIENVYFNGTEITIDNSTFTECTSLQRVSFTQSMKIEIRANAFSECSSLISFDLPEKTNYIGNSAFFHCVKLIKINLTSTEVLEDSAFSSCSSLQKADLSSALQIIPPELFLKCIALHDVVIPQSVIKIGSSAFNSCESLKSITIPSSVAIIGPSAFKFCSNVISVNFEKGSKLTEISETTFALCYSLQLCEIPATIQIIKEGAFMNCHSLKYFLYFDNPDLKSIGEKAFLNCASLQSFTVPPSTTSIGRNSFENCSLLVQFIYCGTTFISDQNNIFKNCKNLKQVFTPFNYTGDDFGGIPVVKSLDGECKYPDPPVPSKDSPRQDKNLMIGMCVLFPTLALVVAAIAIAIVKKRMQKKPEVQSDPLVENG